ncbi:primosomal protein N' [Desulfovibrio mangrovi]|uniref:replication restart helicase PriA n=1 Tax=Desulfovibrio mangrovi TaxID=2976983 RepID=UPI00224647FA|nr:primosomal protein N' [Desulfovibrio mangrovi]UZP68660.1 primosomal protein N' [Desulfovibrio mangrovi]
MSTLLSIALLSPPFANLSYARPAWLPADLWKTGMRVAVPLGKSGGLRVGVVMDVQAPAAPAGIEVKEALWPLERQPLLTPEYLEMVRQLAVRHLLTPGEVLGSLLPAGLRTSQIRLRVLGSGKPRTLYLKDVGKASLVERSILGDAWSAGNVEVLDAGFDAEVQEVCVVTQDPPWPVRPSAKRQIEVLEYLWENGAVSRKTVLSQCGAQAGQALNALAERGLVAVGALESLAGWACSCPMPDAEESEPDGPAHDAGFQLTQAQQEAVDGFVDALDATCPETRLLYGITGSGKTAVYLELAARTLQRGRSVMLLAPEVALACKLERAARSALTGTDIFLFHGYQTAAEREKTFRALAGRDSHCVIVGTRSALFLPVPKLGTIVLDEEHDGSFKQDERLVYQAKEVAHFRMQQVNGLLVLGSATPDIKTYHAARGGRIPLARLADRVGGGTLPDVELIDIKGLSPSDGLLAASSLTALKETVSRGEQAVILLNRRGYAPLMYCLDCGTVARCPHCEIGLTYHKGRERLICHYCGFATPYPVTCSSCKGLHYLPMGEGTEKLEEGLIHELPPGTKVLRLDRDSTRRPGRMEAILDAFGRGEAQVLVGTQMLSKGHHFPNVTLAIIADGDLGLNLPDYRAAERTFQLLVQASGRAGRGEKRGRVFIQTRDPAHYCWEFVRNADYDGFFEEEIRRRERRRYPPFVKLALVRASFPTDWAQGAEWMESLTALAREKGRAAGVLVLGHTPSPLPLLRGRKRFQWAFKAQEWTSIRAVFHEMRQAAPRDGKMRLSLDIDPVNML